MIFVFLLMSLSNVVFSQNNIEKTAKSIEEGAKLIGSVKGLFSKKKKDSTSIQGTDEKTQTNGAFDQSGLSSNVIIVGKITPQTILVDCDEMAPFNAGAAVIRKGKSYAIIDNTGRFIVPFNKYSDIEMTNKLYGDFAQLNGSGVFIAKNNSEKKIFLDVRGNVLYAETELWGTVTGSLSWDRKTIVVQTRDKNTNRTSLSIIGNNGKKYPASVTFSEYFNREDAGSYYVTDTVLRYFIFDSKKFRKYFGFKNFDGTSVAPQFEDLDFFREGLAVFQKNNEFDEKRWGVINSKGEIVIPPQFTNKPTEFRSGIAYVKASSTASFVSALINTKGEPIYKNTKESIEKYDEFGIMGLFQHDVIGTYSHVLEKSGKVYSNEEYAAKLGIKVGSNMTVSHFRLQSPTFAQNDGQIRFHYSSTKLSSGGGVGVYDIKTGKVLIANGNSLDNKNFMYRDPVSGLRHVIIDAPRNSGEYSKETLEGYINDVGEFVLLKGKPKSDW